MTPETRDQGPGPMRYAGLGIELAVMVLAGVFGGQWLDGRLSTSPLFTVLGPLLAFGGWMYSLIRQLNRDEAQRRRSGGGGGQ